MLQELVDKYYHNEKKYQKEYKEEHPDLARQAIAILVQKKLNRDLEFSLVNKLTPEEQLQLARDYNALSEPSKLQTNIMSQFNVRYNDEREFDNDTSKEIMRAYEKCADMMQKQEFSDSERQLLGYKIKYFVRIYPETTAMAVKIYDKHLADVDVIDGVRSCMSRNDKLLDKGFAVIHKMADSICKKENNPLAASDRLRLAFADLYGYYPIKEPDKLDKITEHFIEFTPQMEREHQSSLHYNITTRGLQSEKAKLQTEILWSSFLAMEDNAFGNADLRPFAEIYAEKKAKRAEELQNAALMKVKSKIKRNNQKQAAEPEQITIPNSLKYPLIYAGPRKPSPEQFRPVRRRQPRYYGFEDPKPEGGLWTSFASKEDINVGEWQLYCDKEMPSWNEHKLRGSWHIVPNEDCRILEFKNIDDVRPYIRTSRNPRNPCSDFELEQGVRDYWNDAGNPLYIDYAAMSKDYDVFVFPEDAGERNPLFGDWTRSGFVMNLDKVKVMENDEYTQFHKSELQKFGAKISNGYELDKLKVAGNTEHNMQIMQILKMAHEINKNRK